MDENTSFGDRRQSVLNGEFRNPFAVIDEQRIPKRDDCARPPLGRNPKSSVEIRF